MSENIPFRLAGSRNPLILVPVYVNAKGPYQFILDTGASHCLLSPELSATLEITPETEKQATGAGGAVTLAFAHVNSLTLGSVRQQNVQVAITSEIQRVSAAVQTALDGVLGFNFLKDFVLEIDYQKSVFQLAPPSEPDNATGPRSGHVISFKLVSPVKPLILVPAIVNGQGPYQFALDTGASRTILSSRVVEELKVATTNEGPATGGGGQVQILAGTVGSLAVGDARVRDHAIGAGEFLNMLSTALGARLDGIIGHNFLNQFKVTIDYPRSALHLLPAGSS